MDKSWPSQPLDWLRPSWNFQYKCFNGHFLIKRKMENALPDEDDCFASFHWMEDILEHHCCETIDNSMKSAIAKISIQTFQAHLFLSVKCQSVSIALHLSLSLSHTHSLSLTHTHAPKTYSFSSHSFSHQPILYHQVQSLHTIEKCLCWKQLQLLVMVR